MYLFYKYGYYFDITGFPPGGDEHTMINMYNFGSLKFPESEDLSIDVECKWFIQTYCPFGHMLN